MLFAICFNLDQSKILASGNGSLLAEHGSNFGGHLEINGSKLKENPGHTNEYHCKLLTCHSSRQQKLSPEILCCRLHVPLTILKQHLINSLPNNKIFDESKFKAFADNK